MKGNIWTCEYENKQELVNNEESKSFILSEMHFKH